MSHGSDAPEDGKRGHRFLSSGCLVVLVVALCLLGALVCNLVSQRKSADHRALDQIQASVEDARERLRSAASDGTLTDEEIQQALRLSQASARDTVRTEDTVTVKALVRGTHASAVGGGEVTRCHRFRVVFSAKGTTVGDGPAKNCDE
ncbi:hypothetical protein OHS59_16865 [Streptomyces sp. NBC_00414]|uniref:hypothetical protein n=1 Tax=Streptomyces sp. NBC_00414 TaxID=2975739 RepID=UPI002E20A427